MKFLKYVLGVNMLTNNYMVCGKLGQFSLDIIVKKRMLNYWQKIIAGKDTKLCKIMYDSLLKLHMHNAYTSPWINITKLSLSLKTTWYNLIHKLH